MSLSSLSLRPLCAAVPVRLCHVALAVSSLASQAQVQEPVLVTALRLPERVGALAAEVSVIDRATLDRSAGRTLSEVLAQLPGIQSSSNGGLGKTSSLFFRGLEARHTLLLVDGVRVGSATVGTPSLDNLPLDAVERIEVVRGPMSALYGSDAVGGVVQIFTRRGRPGLQHSARLTAGGERQGQLSAGLGWAAGGFDAALQLQHTEQRGASATNPRAQFGSYNPDRDGFRQDGGSLRLGWQLTPDWRLDGVALRARGRSDLDDGPGADAQAGLLTDLLRVQAEGRVLPGWQTQLSVSRSTDAYDTLSSASPFATLGRIQTKQTQVSWENRVATPVGTALVLAERLQQAVSRPGTPFSVSDRSINALGLGLNGSAGGHLWQAALRHDRNSQFGGQTTGISIYSMTAAAIAGRTTAETNSTGSAPPAVATASSERLVVLGNRINAPAIARTAAAAQPAASPGFRWEPNAADANATSNGNVQTTVRATYIQTQSLPICTGSAAADNASMNPISSSETPSATTGASTARGTRTRRASC